MESRVSGNAHARFGVGENPEVSSPKDYLSLYCFAIACRKNALGSFRVMTKV